MLKRTIVPMRCVAILALTVCVLFVLIASPVLAVDYEVSAATGWYGTTWWGTSIIEASEVVSWLEAQTSGFEVFALWWQKDWEVSNKVYNTWIAGITGYGTLETDPGSSSYCHNVALGWWPGGVPERDDAYIDPHPYHP